MATQHSISQMFNVTQELDMSVRDNQIMNYISAKFIRQRISIKLWITLHNSTIKIMLTWNQEIHQQKIKCVESNLQFRSTAEPSVYYDWSECPRRERGEGGRGEVHSTPFSKRKKKNCGKQGINLFFFNPLSGIYYTFSN